MSTALVLLQALQDANVEVSLSESGGLRLSGHRPPPALLKAAKTNRDALLAEVRYWSIPRPGSDLIPRATRDDARYADVDLEARAHDRDALSLGLRRVMPYRDLPNDTRAAIDRVASELKAAGPGEIGRYATDVLYAYSDVPGLSPMVESAMYYAWACSIVPDKPEDAP